MSKPWLEWPRVMFRDGSGSRPALTNRALRALESFDTIEQVTMSALYSIKGVGRSTAREIGEEFHKHGHPALAEELARPLQFLSAEERSQIAKQSAAKVRARRLKQANETKRLRKALKEALDAYEVCVNSHKPSLFVELHGDMARLRRLRRVLAQCSPQAKAGGQ